MSKASSTSPSTPPTIATSGTPFAKERFGVYAVMAGYALMMALDVGLG